MEFCPAILLRNTMQKNSNTVYLLLGGNLGNVRELFQRALNEIGELVGVITRQSPVYKTEPWGFHSEHHFLNQVVCVVTRHTPERVLSEILTIEKKLGRQRNGSEYDSRPIDIDILFYNNCVIHTKNLTVPHPRLHLRNFALKPLNDISPQWVHPVLGKTVSELLYTCEDTMVAEPLGRS